VLDAERPGRRYPFYISANIMLKQRTRESRGQNGRHDAWAELMKRVSAVLEGRSGRHIHHLACAGERVRYRDAIERWREFWHYHFSRVLKKPSVTFSATPREKC